MACEVCEHCNTAVAPGESAVHNGLSYHKQCRKCYVCGETDLRDAETFRGVIFCSGCSRRIFQGCSTARQAKSMKTKRRPPGPKRKRRSHDRVLEMTMNNRSGSDSRSSRESNRKFKKASVHTSINKTKTDHFKKDSIEQGTTTDVTHDMLKRVTKQHVERIFPLAPAKSRKKRKTHKRKEHKNDCSDLRIAELGASVEIAHMALRKQSELPVVIKSEVHLRNTATRSLSLLNQESGMSGDDNRWRDSTSTSDGDTERTPWLQRGLGSILKIPLRSFKRNILDRSSLISVRGFSRTYKKSSAFKKKKLKFIFNEDITEHQRNGLKKLYSTINRKKKPFKLGWLNLGGSKSNKRCKHFDTSHSYRCMRQQVMRLAGPTRSELSILRGKILNIVSPAAIKNIISYRPEIKMAMRRDFAL